MSSAFEKLIKVLSLEQSMGYSNRSVIGGLDKYALHWKAEALSRAPSERARAEIESIAKRLEAYPSCETSEQRRTIIQGLLHQLETLTAEEVSSRPAGAPDIEDRVPRPALHKPSIKVVDKVEAEPATIKPEVTQEKLGEDEHSGDGGNESDLPAEDSDLAVFTSDDLQELLKEEETESAIVAHSPPMLKPAAPADEPLGKEGTPVPAKPAGRTASVFKGYGLDSPITCLPSVGDTHAARLGRLGVRLIRDLLYLFPRRYEDYSRLKSIRNLTYGETVTIIANVGKCVVRQLGPGRSVLKCCVSDGTGSMEITWFNQPFLAPRLQASRQIVVSGRVEQFLGRPTMTSPEWEPLDKELIHTGRLVPVYPLTEGVSNRWLRRLVKRTVDHWAERVTDYLPAVSRERNNLPGLGWALKEIHFPADHNALKEARRRLAFDEFLMIQLGVLRQRSQWRSQQGRPILVERSIIDQFLAGLPFELTRAQRRVLDEVLSDMAQPTPMNRLLQGDVGSGKTVVAATAMLATVAAGYQAALMVPTEILAEQHFRKLQSLFQACEVRGRPVNVRLLTGNLKAADREIVYSEIEGGLADCVVGTHAIIQEGVQFRDLALAIVDEQHRFGVRQRAALRGKGYNPHLLVMTATPIPRTLSLTIFGDLDVSVMDELPAGRQPITTYIVTERERERAYRFIRRQVEQGHQAFIICPLVEESDKIEARSAVAEYERLQREIFPTLRLGLLHGRMNGDEKEAVMKQFQAGQLDILVSTAVVEVGIDVPNATVMLIEGANRFGLAQLHQFRGRVGRGEAASYCLLLADSSEEEAMARLRAVAESQDGFALAEMDLQMRGPGEFFGTRQSGLPDLRIGQMADVRVLEAARAEAQMILAEDPELGRPENLALRAEVSKLWARASEPS